MHSKYLIAATPIVHNIVHNCVLLSGRGEAFKSFMHLVSHFWVCVHASTQKQTVTYRKEGSRLYAATKFFYLDRPSFDPFFYPELHQTHHLRDEHGHNKRHHGLVHVSNTIEGVLLHECEDFAHWLCRHFGTRIVHFSTSMGIM